MIFAEWTWWMDMDGLPLWFHIEHISFFIVLIYDCLLYVFIHGVNVFYHTYFLQ